MKNHIYSLMGIDHSYIHSTTVLCDMYMYCIERSVNISVTRITRINNKYFCFVATSDDISTHADFQVVGYHGCWVLLISNYNTLQGEITISST